MAHDRLAEEAGAPAPWSVSVHADWRPLESTWRTLEMHGTATTFQRYDWIAPWYATVIASRLAKPVIVSVTRGNDPAPVMLLPLALHVEKRLKTMTFADLRVSDYVAPVLAPDHGLTPASFAELWNLVLKALPSCDLVRLRKIPEQIGGVSNPLAWLKGCTPYSASAYGVAIRAPFADASREIIGSKMFRKIRSSWTRLCTEAPVRFEVHEGSETANALFETFVAQRQARFRALQRRDIFDDTNWCGFYRALTRGTHGRPIAVLSALLSDGAPIATNFGVVFNNVFHDLAQGFVPGHLDRYSPGTLLNYRTMEWAAEHGLSYYDFTVGDEPYKRHFGAVECPLFEWISPRSSIGMAAFGFWRGKQFLDRVGTRQE